MAARNPSGTKFSATLEFRTSLDQAGRIAGLAGELETSEAEVLRRMLNWTLSDPKVLGRLRAELQADVDERERQVRDAERTGKIPGGVPLDV